MATIYIQWTRRPMFTLSLIMWLATLSDWPLQFHPNTFLINETTRSHSALYFGLIYLHHHRNRFFQFSFLFLFFLLCRWRSYSHWSLLFWTHWLSIIREFVAVCIDCTTINLRTVETWRSQIDNRTVNRQRKMHIYFI